MGEVRARIGAEYKSARPVDPVMYGRILVPTDGSEASARAAEEAFAIAAEGGGTVHVLAVVDESPSSLLLTGESMGPLMERLNEEAERNVEAIAAAAPGELDVRTEVIRGTAVYRAIVGYAEEVGADLVVMGSTGRGGVGGILGSTTQRVTEHTGVPVLVVSDPAEVEEE